MLTLTVKHTQIIFVTPQDDVYYMWPKKKKNKKKRKSRHEFNALSLDELICRRLALGNAQ